MTTLSDLQERLDKLNAALASGVFRVEHGVTSTTYQTTSEMLKAKADLERDIAAAGGTSRRRVRYAYQSGKGL